MTDEQKRKIEESVKVIASVDAQAINETAFDVNLNQKYVYAFFIEYHKSIFEKMYGETI